ncbi:MAG: CAP domain-containing protein [Litoreibacter sp.]|nr:CAP domain-containing protein [Litoreibacter sp.]MCY4334973.1 CAP domain-containing protein [Litoreibacter sp.]
MRVFLIALILLGLAQCGPVASPATNLVAQNAEAPAARLALLSSELNGARQSNGRAPLKFNQRLQAAAQAHADDMARRGFFSHVSPDGRDLRDRLAGAGYRFCFAAENIAQGQSTAAEVMGAWMNSAGHRRNNLSREAREFGAARAPGNTWVLVFGAPC